MGMVARAAGAGAADLLRVVTIALVAARRTLTVSPASGVLTEARQGILLRGHRGITRASILVAPGVVARVRRALSLSFRSQQLRPRLFSPPALFGVRTPNAR